MPERDGAQTQVLGLQSQLPPSFTDKGTPRWIVIVGQRKQRSIIDKFLLGHQQVFSLEKQE
jgi:hypothetical protein